MNFHLFLEKTNRIIAPIGMVALVIMMTVVSINVILRIFFGLPIFGTVEVVELTGVIFLSLIFAYTQFKGENIYVEIVIDRLPQRLQTITNSLTMFLNLVIIAVLVWAGSIRALETVRFHEVTPIFRISQALFRFCWVFGCVILFLVLLEQFSQYILRMKK